MDDFLAYVLTLDWVCYLLAGSLVANIVQAILLTWALRWRPRRQRRLGAEFRQRLITESRRRDV